MTTGRVQEGNEQQAVGGQVNPNQRRQGLIGITRPVEVRVCSEGWPMPLQGHLP